MKIDLPPVTEQVTLYLNRQVADQYAEAVENERQVVADALRTNRMSSKRDDRVEAAKVRVAEVRESAQAADAKMTFTLASLRGDEYRDLVVAHPPRKDDDRDKQLGVNEQDFQVALVEACIQKAITQGSPVVDGVGDEVDWADGDYAYLAGQDGFRKGDSDRFMAAVNKINSGDVPVPF